MDALIGEVLGQARGIAEDVQRRLGVRMRSATVVEADPTLIRYDGEATPSIVPPRSVVAVSVGDRVVVAKSRGQATILGVLGGPGSGDGAYSPRRYGVKGDGITDDTAAWIELMQSVPAGAIIECPPGDQYRTTAPVTIPHSVTIQGGDWQPTHPAECFRIESSDVTIRGARITAVSGPGSSPHKVIHALGTQPSPHRNITITGVSILNSRHAGIWLQWCEDVLIEDTTIRSPAYVGVMLNSVARATLRRVQVHDVLQLGYTQSYGISVTDSTNDEAGRSRDILVTDCLIDGCKWEGISTHSALRFRVIGNVLRSCYSGIAALSGNTTRIVPVHDAVISGNTISRADAEVGEVGIKFHGSQSTAAQPATGTVTGNAITGYARAINAHNVYRPGFQCSGNSAPEVAWTAIPLEVGWRDGAEPAQYMIDSNTLTLRGTPTKTAATSGSLNTIGTVPAMYAPVVTRYLGTSMSIAQNNNALVRVTDTGVLQLQSETVPAAGGGYHPINFTCDLT